MILLIFFRDQIEENNAIIEDLDKREEAYAAVKRAANDVINKANNKADPAVKDIKKKLERLNSYVFLMYFLNFHHQDILLTFRIISDYGQMCKNLHPIEENPWKKRWNSLRSSGVNSRP